MNKSDIWKIVYIKKGLFGLLNSKEFDGIGMTNSFDQIMFGRRNENL